MGFGESRLEPSSFYEFIEGGVPLFLAAKRLAENEMQFCVGGIGSQQRLELFLSGIEIACVRHLRDFHKWWGASRDATRHMRGLECREKLYQFRISTGCLKLGTERCVQCEVGSAFVEQALDT